MKKFFIFGLFGSFLVANELHVYSSRPLNEDLVALFEKQNKAKIIQINGKFDELIQKAKSENGDVFLGGDISTIAKAKEEGIFAPLKSKILQKLIPAHLIDKDNEYFAYAKRARVIGYDKSVAQNANLVQSYEDLAKPEFKGKILMRSSKISYSVTLLASIIAHEGEAKAREWAKGLKANLAREPKGGDRAQAAEVIAKRGDFAVMNVYYVGVLKNSKKEEDRKVGDALGIIYPNQKTTGTHINVSAVALLKSSKNKALAQKFMEFMLSKEAQKIVSDTTLQFPIRNDIKLSPMVQSFGTFKEDTISISEIAKNANKAREIYKEVDFK